MQLMVDAQLIVERRDSYMLQYYLRQPNMVSHTEYKVLQNQGAFGLIPCYHVVYNSSDKLDYIVEDYQTFSGMLPELQPSQFLYYVNAILAVILNLRDVGFLHACCLETELDKIFIDRNDNSVHMVYLPLALTYLNQMNPNYAEVFKRGLLQALNGYANLQNEMVRHPYALLSDPASTLDYLKTSLSCFDPVPQQAAPPGTASLGNTGDVSMAPLTFGAHRQAAESGNYTEPVPGPEQVSGQKAKKTKKLLFGFKKKSAREPAFDDAGDSTEVLTLFVPSIYLKGQDTEFLVNKREYVLGRQESADGRINSTAVSREHCKITCSDGRNYVIDLGSANGTYLNGGKLEPNKPRPVNEGDKIKLGNLGFTVVKA